MQWNPITSHQHCWPEGKWIHALPSVQSLWSWTIFYSVCGIGSINSRSISIFFTITPLLHYFHKERSIARWHVWCINTKQSTARKVKNYVCRIGNQSTFCYLPSRRSSFDWTRNVTKLKHPAFHFRGNDEDIFLFWTISKQAHIHEHTYQILSGDPSLDESVNSQNLHFNDDIFEFYNQFIHRGENAALLDSDNKDLKFIPTHCPFVSLSDALWLCYLGACANSLVDLLAWMHGADTLNAPIFKW